MVRCRCLTEQIVIILQKYGWQAAAEPDSIGAGGHLNIFFYIFLRKCGVKQLLQKMLFRIRAVWFSRYQHLSQQVKELWVMPGGLCVVSSLEWQRDWAGSQFGFLAFSLPWLNQPPPTAAVIH